MLFVSMAGLVSVDLSGQTPDQQGSERQVSRYRFGLNFLLDSRRENVDLVLPGYLPTCGRIVEGSGQGWEVGGLLDYALSPTLRLQGSVGLVRSTGTLVHRGDLFPIRTETGGLVNGRVDQVMEYASTGLDLSLLGSYPLSEKFSLLGGFGLWTRLFSEETQKETAVEPESLLLTNNQRAFTVADGVLLTIRPLVPRIIAGVRYNLPIGGDSWLSPEARASWTPLSWTSVDGSWRTLTLSLGGSIRFGLPGGDHAVAVLPPPDTLQPPPLLIPEIRTSPEVVQVVITEYDSTEALPLLNRVYFDRGSAEIPERYRQIDLPSTTSFSTTDLTGPTLETYYDVMNVIGLRLTRLFHANLTVTGYRNATESDTSLGRRRAEAIEQYLVNTWEIAPDRIEVRGEELPPNPASERTVEGREENRMAQLVSSNPNVTIPIIRNYVQRVATPPLLTFYPKVIHEEPIAGWSITISSRDESWRTLSGEGMPPDEIEWDWRNDSLELPTLPLDLNYQFVVQDSAGNRSETRPIDIYVEMNTLQERLVEERQDTIIESYSLLLFNYNSPEVSRADRALLNAIARRVSPGARVRFTGYTDSLGDARVNRDLAMKRAEAAAEIFDDAVDFELFIEINPEGGEKERYTYRLPEGRSYDRTVIIEVRTPVRRRE